MKQKEPIFKDAKRAKQAIVKATTQIENSKIPIDNEVKLIMKSLQTSGYTDVQQEMILHAALKKVRKE